MARIAAHLMLYHSGGDSVVLGIVPASPTSWDLGPRHHIRFGVGGTLNSMKPIGPLHPCSLPLLLYTAYACVLHPPGLILGLLDPNSVYGMQCTS